MTKGNTIGCAVIGYGATHNFGRMHCRWIEENPQLKLVAVCERDAQRAATAKQEFPKVRTYTTTKDLWRDQDVEMVTIVTPNFTHCPLAKEASAHGRHVLTENGMCLSTAEATAMIKAAKAAGKMLCVHHNRRHDGNYRLIKEIVDSGRIGQVFHVELTPGQYGHPFLGHTDSWWADKQRSGGGFFYYGPQAIDWLLDLVPQPIAGVTGFTQKLVWKDITFEDQVSAIIRFESGAVANFTESHIRAAKQPFWRILGTKGAIVDSGQNATAGYEHEIHHSSSGSLQLFTVQADQSIKEETLPYKDSDWHMFYRDIASHLLTGKPVPISGECGRRVIGVIETALKSSESGRTELPPYR
jgi:scyllo-inositol 2-dehydrogenase (NADP+)